MFLLLNGNESSLKKVHAIIIICECSWTLPGPTLIWPGALSLSLNPEESQRDSGIRTDGAPVSVAGLRGPGRAQVLCSGPDAEAVRAPGPLCASRLRDRGNERSVSASSACLNVLCCWYIVNTVPVSQFAGSCVGAGCAK